MKTHAYRFICLLIAAAAILACDNSLTANKYFLELPELSPAWTAALPAVHWKIEWRNSNGQTETLTISGGETAEIDFPQWTSAALAWPYWPEKGIAAGIFRPAGGLFPFDSRGNSIALSWRGGVDAFLYREMERAAAKYSSVRAAVPRLPWNFNWPRFRELFSDPAVNAELRADPWLADWPAIAENIVRRGFDKRRLSPRARVELSVPPASGAGTWTGTSPFAAPLYFENTPVFSVSAAAPAEADTWVCARGIVRCNSRAWIFTEWE